LPKAVTMRSHERTLRQDLLPLLALALLNVLLHSLVNGQYGFHRVENEELRSGIPIQICREPLRPWPTLWAELQSFG
jgi:hypothetical protein